jgi:outer membrane biosynthesis protein TonB
MSRESSTPLLIALLLALAVHVAAAAGYTVFATREPQPRQAAPRPDLAIDSLSVGSPRLVGQPTPITLTVKNLGPVASSAFSLDLAIDDQLLQQLALPQGLAPGSSTSVTLSFTADRPGPRRVTARADAAADIPESSESNNEQTVAAVWLAPPSPGSASPGSPDLAVFDLTVANPRIARIAAPTTVRFANVGSAPTPPARFLLSVDGSQHGDIIDLPSLQPGSVFEHNRDLIVATPGDHDIAITPLAGSSLGDADAANDQLARRLHWLEHDPLKPGQDAPSAVRMNWVSEKEFQDLVARRARFDQATAQQDVKPIDTQRTPDDPTPPAPAPAVAQVAPPMPRVAPDPAQPHQVAQPTPTPDTPRQPEQPRELPPAPKLTLAPALPDTPAAQAAAPRQADTAVKPTEIKPVRTPDPLSPPQPVVDASPATDPVAAPPVTVPVSPEMAINTPKVPSAAGPDPLLPRTVDVPDPSNTTVALRAPAVEPDPASRPTDATRAVDAPAAAAPVIAALPLTPRPDMPPGSPPTPPLPPSVKPDAPMNQAPAQPTDPQQPTTDGQQPEPRQAAGSPSSQQAPQTAAPKSNPTAAPQQPREAPPVSRIEGQVKPGAVIARYGIEIRTIRPRFSTIAVRSSIPANPTVQVVFDKLGDVVDARILKSSGYANIDSPILNSLYRWKATGENLKKLTGNLTVEIRFLLNDLDD